MKYVSGFLVCVKDQDTRLRMPNKWYIFKEGQAATKIDIAAACLCFLNYLAFRRPAADRAVSILPWVVSRGRSYGFLWAVSIIQKNVRKDDPTPAYSLNVKHQMSNQYYLRLMSTRHSECTQALSKP
jgi:hypothetical protein